MSMTEQDEPEVGDFILLFDAESDEAGEPPILLVRVTEDGFAGIAEGYLEQADQLEARARFLAHGGRTRAWRLVGEEYALLPPYESANDVH
jgi:hypothetical protein